MCTHLDDDIFICLEADVSIKLDALALTSFDDQAYILRGLDCNMFVYLDA